MHYGSIELQEFDGTSSVSQLSEEASLLVPAEELARARPFMPDLSVFSETAGRGADRGGGRREARTADLQQVPPGRRKYDERSVVMKRGWLSVRFNRLELINPVDDALVATGPASLCRNSACGLYG